MHHDDIRILELIRNWLGSGNHNRGEVAAQPAFQAESGWRLDNYLTGVPHMRSPGQGSDGPAVP
jgi:hypothetical protein